MIKLHVNVGRRFKAGAVIEDDALDADFLAGLIRQGFAERAPGDDELPAELVAAMAAFSQLAASQHQQLKVLVGAGIEAGPAGAAAVLAMFQDLQLQAMDLAPGILQLQALAGELEPAAIAGGQQQQDEPDADDQRSGSSGSGSGGNADPEALAGGGPTDAEDKGGADDTAPPPPPPPPPPPAPAPAVVATLTPAQKRAATIAAKAAAKTDSPNG